MKRSGAKPLTSMVTFSTLCLSVTLLGANLFSQATVRGKEDERPIPDSRLSGGSTGAQQSDNQDVKIWLNKLSGVYNFHEDKGDDSPSANLEGCRLPFDEIPDPLDCGSFISVILRPKPAGTKVFRASIEQQIEDGVSIPGIINQELKDERVGISFSGAGRGFPQDIFPKGDYLIRVQGRFGDEVCCNSIKIRCTGKPSTDSKG